MRTTSQPLAVNPSISACSRIGELTRPGLGGGEEDRHRGHLGAGQGRERRARRIEGEGDGSLAYWRDAHWAFFSRECARIGRAPSEAMPVVCSVFEVLAIVR